MSHPPFDLQVTFKQATPEQSKKILKALLRWMTPQLPAVAARMGLGTVYTPEERKRLIAERAAEALAEYP